MEWMFVEISELGELEDFTAVVCSLGNGGSTATFDLFDSESGQDLTLSPQTFTSSTEAFINDNSDSLGVPGDTDTGTSSLKQKPFVPLKRRNGEKAATFHTLPFGGSACQRKQGRLLGAAIPHHKSLLKSVVWYRPSTCVDVGIRHGPEESGSSDPLPPLFSLVMTVVVGQYLKTECPKKKIRVTDLFQGCGTLQKRKFPYFCNYLMY
uniref:Uncharacterized protein n=1 Tax=Timema cristinae TaxID=61476 RepID=A0A7R9CCI2_TIMCR|nr:unnamed protein product [Timema cristinae]